MSDEDCAKTNARNNKALAIAMRSGQSDEAWHLEWCIDQMVRALTGEAYSAWVAEYEDGENYVWDTGIAP